VIFKGCIGSAEPSHNGFRLSVGHPLSSLCGSLPIQRSGLEPRGSTEAKRTIQDVCLRTFMCALRYGGCARETSILSGLLSCPGSNLRTAATLSRGAERASSTVKNYEKANPKSPLSRRNPRRQLNIPLRLRRHPKTSRSRRARGKGSRSSSHSKPKYAPVFQVDVSSTARSVSPLYLWERARVRAGSKSGKHNHGKTQSKKKRPEGRQKIHLLPKEQGASKGEFASTAQSENRQRILDNHPHFIQIRLERRGAGGGLAQT
jgi:hypothetical protein